MKGFKSECEVTDYDIIEVNFGRFILTHQCIIVQNMQFAIVLGNDFQNKYGIDILYSKQVLMKEDLIIPFCKKQCLVPQEPVSTFKVLFEEELGTVLKNYVLTLEDFILEPMTMNQIPVTYSELTNTDNQ